MVGGYSWVGCPAASLDFAVFRYNPDGSLDPTFGNGGKSTTDFGAQSYVLGLMLQPDGRIIAGGSTTFQYGIARYNSDGSLDSTFGSGGKTVTSFDDQTYIASRLSLQPDGKVIAIGSSFGQFTLARYETGIPVPLITSVTVSGKKLFVTGANFDSGSTILLNGQEQKTKPKSDDPSTLIGVKAGNVIQPGDKVRVRDSNGFLSTEFIF